MKFLFATIFTVISLDAALAQVITQDPNVVSGQSIFGLFRPYLVDILAVIVTACVAWAAITFQRLTGIEVEAKHREALQTSLKNAAALLVDSVDKKVDDINFRTSDPKVAEAIRYVTNGAPDALKYFGLSSAEVAEKLKAWVPQVDSPVVVAPVVTPPVEPAPVNPTPQGRRY